MKILVGEFITESNANIPQKCEISNYKMLFGDDCIQALHVADVFEQAGFELIPSVVADAGAAGVIKKDTFDYIESCFVRTVKEHIHEIDGMFLMLHVLFIYAKKRRCCPPLDVAYHTDRTC